MHIRPIGGKAPSVPLPTAAHAATHMNHVVPPSVSHFGKVPHTVCPHPVTTRAASTYADDDSPDSELENIPHANPATLCRDFTEEDM